MNRERYDFSFSVHVPRIQWNQSRWLPTPGNVIFTLLVVGSLIWIGKSSALQLFAAPNGQTTSTGTIAYQGRLADASGNPLTDTVNMIFRLYAAASGGAPLWEEQWTGANSVQVSDGLFNVMLGSVSPIGQAVITGNSNLFLGITVGTDSEMSPRVQLGSVPFATQALTVPNESITSEKLASNVFQNYSATTSQINWQLPACGGGATIDENWKTIPDLSIDISLEKTKSVWVDFTGLGANSNANRGIFSSIFINDQMVRLDSGEADYSGCRNGTQDPGSSAFCSFTNMRNAMLTAGTYKIEVRTYCDGGTATVRSGSLRVFALP